MKNKTAPYFLEKYFAKQKDVLCAYLFGSTASGKENKFSDVDIAVLFDDNVPGEEYSDKCLSIMDGLSRILDRNLDVVALNTASTFLKFQILKAGLRVYERLDRTRHDFEAKTIVEYFDFLPIRKKLETALLNNLKG